MSDPGPRAPASPAPPPEGAVRTTGEAGSSAVVLQAFDLHKRFVEGRGANALDVTGSSIGGPRKITKEAIFHYCYAVLHDPWYRRIAPSEAR